MKPLKTTERVNWLTRAVSKELLTVCDNEGKIELDSSSKSPSEKLVDLISFRFGSVPRTDKKAIKRMINELLESKYLVNYGNMILLSDFATTQYNEILDKKHDEKLCALNLHLTCTQLAVIHDSTIRNRSTLKARFRSENKKEEYRIPNKISYAKCRSVAKSLHSLHFASDFDTCVCSTTSGNVLIKSVTSNKTSQVISSTTCNTPPNYPDSTPEVNGVPGTQPSSTQGSVVEDSLSKRLIGESKELLASKTDPSPETTSNGQPGDPQSQIDRQVIAEQTPPTPSFNAMHPDDYILECRNASKRHLFRLITTSQKIELRDIILDGELTLNDFKLLGEWHMQGKCWPKWEGNPTTTLLLRDKGKMLLDGIERARQEQHLEENPSDKIYSHPSFIPFNN